MTMSDVIHNIMSLTGVVLGAVLSIERVGAVAEFIPALSPIYTSPIATGCAYA